MTYHPTDSDDDGTIEADVKLPSGYAFTENANNDLIITDDNSNTVFRWDSTNNEWNLEAESLANVASVSATDLNASNSITDANGNTHTGQLAELSDNVENFSTSGDDGEVPVASGGALSMGEVGGGFENIQTFTSDGTFDATDVDLAFVEVIGGGGGGADSSTTTGGAGGGYAAGYVNLESETSVSVTVGSGGDDGTDNSDNSNGLAGESSSFGTFMSATGGDGGNASESGNVGGYGSGGSINIQGGAGLSNIGGGTVYASSGNVDSLESGQNYGRGAGLVGDGYRASPFSGRDGAIIVRY